MFKNNMIGKLLLGLIFIFSACTAYATEATDEEITAFLSSREDATISISISKIGIRNRKEIARSKTLINQGKGA